MHFALQPITPDMAATFGIWDFKHTANVGPMMHTRIVVQRVRAGFRVERHWQDAAWEVHCERSFVRTRGELETTLREMWPQLAAQGWNLVSGHGMAATFDLCPSAEGTSTHIQCELVNAEAKCVQLSLTEGGSNTSRFRASKVYACGSDCDSVHFGGSREAAEDWLRGWVRALSPLGWQVPQAAAA